MWILEQTNKEKTRFKYLASDDYNVIISYINRFSGVKKYNDYYFISRDDVYFKIYLGEDLDSYEKTSKKKEFNKKTFYNKEYRHFGKRNKKVS